MSAWGNNDRANNSPKFTSLQVNVSATTANQTKLYANTKVGTFINNEAVGVFGVNSTEVRVNENTKNRVSHSGWVLRSAHTGPVVGITVTNPTAYVYANDYITFTGDSTTSANAQIITRNGNVVSVILNSGGQGYAETPTASASAANNANLVFNIVMGGRANRVQTEVLSCISSFDSNVRNSGIY